MQIRVLLPIRNFRPEVEGSLQKIFGFTIKNGANLDTIPPQELYSLEYSLGAIALKKLKGSYYLEYIGEISNNEFLIGDETEEDLCRKILNNIALFFRLFWFVKDNSISVNYVYIIYIDILYVTGRFKSDISMNSMGRNSITEINSTEISQVNNMFDDLKRFSVIDIHDQDVKMFDVNKSDPNPINLLPYVTCRLTKSLLFLGLARFNSVLIRKISFYIALLDCLFTVKLVKMNKLEKLAAKSMKKDQHDKLNVNDTLSSRVSLFLNKNIEEAKVVRGNIENAYDVRSRFFHGDNYRQDVKLDELSIEMDILCRSILNKITMLPLGNVFTQVYEENEDLELLNYFMSLKNIR